MRRLLALVLLLSGGCFTAVFGGAGALSNGYASKEVSVSAVEPFEESLAGLTFEPASLRFQCVMFRKASAEKVVTTTHKYGANWKLITFMMGGLEILGGVLPLAIVRGTGGELPTAGRVALQATAVDGLILVALGAGVKEKTVVEESLREAPMEELPACPSEISLQLQGKSYPIDSSGYTNPEGAALLLATMLSPTGSFEVVTPERQIEVSPTPDERCAWALSRNAFEAQYLCPQKPGVFSGLGLRVKVPVKIIIGVDLTPRRR